MISIITPTYNRAQLLPRLIESVIPQNYKNWELIIMDDGSTDNTEKVVKAYNDPRIKYFYTENSGAADKRNQGVKQSKNEYIIFLDSDDEPRVNWLELMVKPIEDNKNVIVSCGWEKVDHENNLIEVRNPKNLGPFFNNITLNYLAGSLMLKKIFFSEIGGFDVNLASGHHTDILLRLLLVFEKNNVCIENIPEPLLRIHCHSGSKIRANHNSVYYGTLLLLKKHESRFKRNKEEHRNYLSVAALSALKIGKPSEAKSLLRKAFLIKPFNFKSIFRVIVVELPFLRNYIWKLNH